MVINKTKYTQCCTKFVSHAKTMGDEKLKQMNLIIFFINVGSFQAKTIITIPLDGILWNKVS